MVPNTLPEVNIFWFRRDLRLDDNAGLYRALSAGKPVLPIFVFDKNILDLLEDRKDPRVEFIHQAVTSLSQQLSEWGAAIEVHHGRPTEVFAQLNSIYSIGAVYANHDSDPYAIERDLDINKEFEALGIRFITFKDHVVFEGSEVVKDDGNPYTVFTPYSRKWKTLLKSSDLDPYPSMHQVRAYYKQDQPPIPSLQKMGFKAVGMEFPKKDVQDDLIRKYGELRDYPALPATSRLGVHLRFGTISIRALCRRVMTLSETYLNELIWREFYHMILFQFPRVGKGYCFKSDYENIKWRNNEEEFERWMNGTTGYPIVDAGMRELLESGHMHNRVRMITASFLTKHLLIDWRWGEAHFARKLLDFDLASNNGGWQWAAGCGCDAAPYFRVFNPYLQTDKFDPERRYINRWVSDIGNSSYPQPIVEHAFARARCLETYASALKKS
jgi:deoxyribodipyrimidine photo-lyase